MKTSEAKAIIAVFMVLSSAEKKDKLIIPCCPCSADFPRERDLAQLCEMSVSKLTLVGYVRIICHVVWRLGRG